MPSKRPFDSLYKSSAWLRRRAHQLRVEPTCRWCAQRGVVTAAVIADHIIPVRGDRNAFLKNELQSLCTQCHNGKWASDKRGFRRDIGPDGFPIDERHPFNLLAAKGK
jgi:5-methylcytosine-specific restriction protein A